MIKLINGFEVKYNDDFDKFFQNLLEAIIVESRQASIKKKANPEEKKSERDLFLQEIMDNCIYITHQLFNLYKDNVKFTQFVITGFIFNSVIVALSSFDEIPESDKNSGDSSGILH